MLTLTPTAKEYLSTMTEHENKNYVRLGVFGGGCSGFTYKWDFVDEAPYAWRKKYPHVTEKIDQLEKRIKKLEK